MSAAERTVFEDLPPLLVAEFERMAPGEERSLLLLEYFEAGGSATFPVRYVHRELAFRTPGQKDAVAFGTAMLEGDDQPREARILFSQYYQTATIRGLGLEGPVKAV
ncbi:hypothetical protein [Luteimonas sp. SDU82]|uniref:hypothetical protein n=1 Tax=Luteimonas sp. SDU82 TaxID=3422592 RepID=UPI003EC0F5E2